MVQHESQTLTSILCLYLNFLNFGGNWLTSKICTMFLRPHHVICPLLVLKKMFFYSTVVVQQYHVNRNKSHVQCAFYFLPAPKTVFIKYTTCQHVLLVSCLKDKIRREREEEKGIVHPKLNFQFSKNYTHCQCSGSQWLSVTQR